MTTAPDPTHQGLAPPDRSTWFWTWCVICVVACGFVLRNLVQVPYYGKGELLSYDLGWPEVWLELNRPSGLLPPLDALKEIDWQAVRGNALWAGYFSLCSGILAQYWQQSVRPTPILRKRVLLALCGTMLLHQITVRFCIWRERADDLRFGLEMTLFVVANIVLFFVAPIQALLLVIDWRRRRTARQVEAVNQLPAAQVSPDSKPATESET